MAIEAYDAYRIYHALKLHFNSEYDFNKYNGKANVSISSFLKRKDRPFFAKVARKYISGDSARSFLISNFIKNPRGWVGDFNEQNYIDFKKRIQSLKYNYQNELRELFKKVSNFEESFHVKDGQHPMLLKQFLAKNISLESMCILESLVGFTKYWNNDIEENIVWPIWEKLIKDYISFLTFDRKSYKILTMQTVKEIFTNG